MRRAAAEMFLDDEPLGGMKMNGEGLIGCFPRLRHEPRKFHVAIGEWNLSAFRRLRIRSNRALRHRRRLHA